MNFLYPEFLWGLSALSIPIIIHLFNFRKFKKVYFSNIELLKDVQLETKSKSQLKHLIVLFTRLVAVAFLVFAFAQPYFPVEDSENNSKDNAISVYIDNSYSMDTKGENGYLLELSKEQAIHIAVSYSPTDKFHLISNDLDPKHHRSVSKDEFIQMVEEIEPSFSSSDIADIYLRQSEALLDQEGQKALYWLSDFQKNTTSFSSIKKDSSLSVYLLPYPQEKKGNVYLDSVWFDSPIRKINDEEKVSSTVVNNTASPIELKLELYVNDVLQGFGNFIIQDNSKLTCEIPYTIEETGIQHCKLVITDYPDPDMTFDDEFHFTYHVKDVLSILELNDELSTDTVSSISKLFRKDPLFKYQGSNFSNVDFSNLSNYNLIIIAGLDNITSGLSTELNQFCEQGGSLLLFPGEELNLISYNSFLQEIGNGGISSIDTNNTKVNFIDAENPLYENIFEILPKNIDLPTVSNHYPVSFATNSNMEPLMKYQNGEVFLSKSKVKNGHFYFSTVALNTSFSNFSKHAIFVASLLRIAELSQPKEKLWNVIGTDNSISLNKSKDASSQISINALQSEFEFIPEVRKTKELIDLLLYDQVKKAGHYNIVQNKNNLNGFSFNYDRKESKFEFFDNEELNSIISTSPIGEQTSILAGADSSAPISVNEIAEGKKLWWHCLLIVLLFLGIETLLLRLWKTN